MLERIVLKFTGRPNPRLYCVVCEAKMVERKKHRLPGYFTCSPECALIYDTVGRRQWRLGSLMRINPTWWVTLATETWSGLRDAPHRKSRAAAS